MAEITISQQQIAEAARYGAALLGPQSNIPIPAAGLEQVLLLRQVLGGIANGVLLIVAAPAAAGNTPETADALAKAINEDPPKQSGGKPRRARR